MQSHWLSVGNADDYDRDVVFAAPVMGGAHQFPTSRAVVVGEVVHDRLDLGVFDLAPQSVGTQQQPVSCSSSTLKMSMSTS